MCVLKLVFVVLTVAYTASGEQPKVVPCNKSDLVCLTKLLNEVIKGYSECGILSAETVIVPDLPIGNGLTLRNIVVTGFLNQRVSEFKSYPDGVTRLLSIETPIQINADVTRDSLYQWNHPLYQVPVFCGRYVAKANVLAYSKGKVTILRNPNSGVENFNIAPEEIGARVIGKPEASLFFHDQFLNPVFEERKLPSVNDFDSWIISKISGDAFTAVVSNIISLSKLFPRRAFFNDL